MWLHACCTPSSLQQSLLEDACRGPEYAISARQRYLSMSCDPDAISGYHSKPQQPVRSLDRFTSPCCSSQASGTLESRPYTKSEASCPSRSTSAGTTIPRARTGSAHLSAESDEGRAQHRSRVSFEGLKTAAVCERPQADGGISTAGEQALVYRRELHAPHAPPVPFQGQRLHQIRKPPHLQTPFEELVSWILHNASGRPAALVVPVYKKGWYAPHDPLVPFARWHLHQAGAAPGIVAAHA